MREIHNTDTRTRNSDTHSKWLELEFAGACHFSKLQNECEFQLFHDLQATPKLIFGTFTAPSTGREDKGGGSSRSLNAVNTEQLEVLAVARRLGVSSHNTVKRIIPNAKALKSKPYHVPLNMTSRGMVRAG